MRIVFSYLLVCVLYTNAASPTEFFGRPLVSDYKKTRFQFQLDFRDSFIGKNISPVKVFGINIGLKLKEKYRFGIGFYFIDQLSNIEQGFDSLGKQIRLKKGEFVANPTYFANRNLFLYYGTVNFTYTLISNKFINLDVPIEIGFGSYAYKIENVRTNHDLTALEIQTAEENLVSIRKFNGGSNRGTFVPILFGIATTIKLHRWVYPQLSGGFRKSVLESDFKADFDGFYYHIGFQIHFGEIFYDIFKKKPLDLLKK